MQHIIFYLILDTHPKKMLSKTTVRFSRTQKNENTLSSSFENSSGMGSISFPKLALDLDRQLYK